MKHFRFASQCVLLLSMVLCAAPFIPAQDETSTEVTGFYQQYRDFSFTTGAPDLDIPATQLKGGGFSIAQNFVPWFALWTQFSFYETVGPSGGLRVRVINNSQGPRWQTKQYGPIRFYVKGGLGFARYSFENIGSDTKLSLSYGGGAQIWMANWLGITLDVSHVLMGLPNLTDLPGRDKWDSGLTLTPGLTIRF